MFFGKRWLLSLSDSPGRVRGCHDGGLEGPVAPIAKNNPGGGAPEAGPGGCVRHAGCGAAAAPAVAGDHCGVRHNPSKPPVRHGILLRCDESDCAGGISPSPAHFNCRGCLRCVDSRWDRHGPWRKSERSSVPRQTGWRRGKERSRCNRRQSWQRAACRIHGLRRQSGARLGPKAVMGMSVVLPYPFVAYQGWVGGIVSVRGDHTSRLNRVRPAAYYLLTVALQITAYSLAVGSGVNVGVSLFRPRSWYQGGKFARIFPGEALLDMLRIYALATPLFLAASLWEFLSPWNI